jgi:putative transcriptional regulator
MNKVINNKFAQLCAKELTKTSAISSETSISRTTLTSLYYRRAKGITFDVLDKLCKYFNCSISEIIEYIDDEQQ